MNRDEIIKSIKIKMIEQGLNHRTLAERIGYERRQLGKALNGHRVGAKLVRRLAEWLGVTVEEIEGLRE